MRDAPGYGATTQHRRAEEAHGDHMNFPDLVELLFETWSSGSTQAIMMLGKPGIGKTAVGRALAARITEHERKLEQWKRDLATWEAEAPQRAYAGTPRRETPRASSARWHG